MHDPQSPNHQEQDSSLSIFDELLSAQAQKTLPPVSAWHPEREGTIDIRIAADGTWFHEGQPIRRAPLVNLFATILRRDQDQFVLVTPAEKLTIAVEDAPFIATDLDVRGSDVDTDLLFTTNVGDHVLADSKCWLLMRDSKPYLHVRDGLEALLTRSVFYRLIDVAREEGGSVCVYSQQTRFELGAASA